MVVSNVREIIERPRIRDVAALAGTSVSTVSNLLNGRPDRMRPETVRRIEEAIEQLGYRPSWAARQLKTGFAPVLGLLVPSVANPFHGAMARAVEVAAQARGYQVVLGNSLRDPARERQYAEDFFDFGIRGVIAGSSPFDLDHFTELMERGLSVVAFDLTATGEGGEPTMDSVSMDNRRAGYLGDPASDRARPSPDRLHLRSDADGIAAGTPGRLSPGTCRGRILKRRRI